MVEHEEQQVEELQQEELLHNCSVEDEDEVMLTVEDEVLKYEEQVEMVEL